VTTGGDIHDAGAGLPVPASSSVDPVEPAARTELERIGRRWGELPLTRAEDAAPAVRKVLVRLAARSAPGTPVPDLGVEGLVDQLTVLVWEAYVADRGDGIPDLLAALRRSLP
jgi:hypothetical protein